MMTAQNDDTKSQVGRSNGNPPALPYLGNVLNSVQGLQQQLGDFSAEEVSSATEKAKTLIVRLSELQRKLRGLANIQRSILAARDEVDQAAAQEVDLSKVNPRPATHDPASRSNENKWLHSTSFGTTFKANLNHPMPKAQSPSQQINFVELNNSAIVPKHTEGESLISDEPTSPAPALHAPAQIEANTRADGDGLATDLSPLQATTKWHAQESHKDISTETRTTPADAGLEARPDLFSRFEAEQPPRDASATASSNGNSGDLSTKALIPISSDIDQRLLADLIKNYGEFMSSPNLPATRDPAKATTKKTNGQDRFRERQQRQSSPGKKNLPSHKSAGELDQQLKKLVKDYGEYDLYSRTSPISLKTGVLGAFLLLAVLLSGFYFLSTPKVADPPVDKTATPPAAISSDVSGGAPKSVENKAEKSTANPVESRQPLEASEKRELPIVNFGETKNFEKVGPP